MLNLNCVICAELFTPSDDVHVTTCGHMFHYACLKQWMERSKSCPQCRNKCTDRNIFRVYFNLANLDVSRIDVGSLQEQLDDAKLKLKIKEKEFNKVDEHLKSLKETQKKCMKTIAGLEQKLQKSDFLILSYNEQIKLLKADARISDDLRKEVKSLKSQIDALESVSTILTASKSEIEKMIKNESDPQKLALWVTTYKRELRISENKRSDLRNVLKVVQNDLRKEMDLKKIHEERISQLESDNYRLNEKIKALESEFSAKNATNSVTPTTVVTSVENALLMPLKREHNRISISPTTKESIKKIEESNSPYLNIKSSSVGLVPLFNRNHETATTLMDANTKTTTTKLATLKISPAKSSGGVSGAIRKTSSDLSEKYSIFKKPRIGIASTAASTGSASFLKPLGPNFVFNGFGGSEKVDPFASRNSDDEIEAKGEENDQRARKLPLPFNRASALSKNSALSLSNRLKTGGLRNFKVNK